MDKSTAAEIWTKSLRLALDTYRAAHPGDRRGDRELLGELLACLFQAGAIGKVGGFYELPVVSDLSTFAGRGNHTKTQKGYRE